MESMKASVVILTKNPGLAFQEVLFSVLNQKAGFSFDVLIIDSGSTDGTVKFLGSLKEPRIKIHEIDPTQFGHGRTRNLAISLTTSQYVAFLTHDAQPASESWLENLVSMADLDDQIAGVFGRHIAHPSASPFTTYELEMHFAGFEATPIVALTDKLRYEKDIGYRQFLHFFSDNNSLIRREVWEKIPYPDVDFAEDQIWAKKIIEAGWRKAYASNAPVFHSHNYGLYERLQRSFDESYAFLHLFGYKLCPTMRSLFRTWAALTRRDLRLARQNHLWKTATVHVLRVPFDNFMRLCGYYLGTNGAKLSQSMREKISRDHRLLKGLARTK